MTELGQLLGLRQLALKSQKQNNFSFATKLYLLFISRSRYSCVSEKRIAVQFMCLFSCGHKFSHLYHKL